MLITFFFIVIFPTNLECSL